MTGAADVELLPLPEPDYLWHQGHGWPDIPAWSENTVRQIVAHHTEKLHAENEALRVEVEKLRTIAWCAYQMAGMHDAPLVWLDRLSEAANGDVLPDADTLMDELLPYQPNAVRETESRAEQLAEASSLKERS